MRLFLFLALIILVGTSGRAQDAKFEFVDLAKNIPGDYERGIRAKLRTLKDRNISIYAANAPATVSTSFILSEGEKKAKEYDMVFYVGVNQQAGNKWDYSYRIKPGMEQSVLFQECVRDFQLVFKKYCPAGKKMSSTNLRKMWAEAFDKILENEAQISAVSNSGQITHRVRVSPYLPVSSALENQIVQFGQLVRGALTDWEKARVIHTAADKVADLDYPTYLSKAVSFTAGLKKLVDDFNRDITQNSSFKGLYTAGLDAGLVDQDAHFRQVGNYTGNPMYYRRAHDILKRELARGKTPAALKELGSLENTLAYHDLYDLYVWLGKEEWLANPPTTYKEGKKWKQKTTNNYKFNTLIDEEKGGGVGFKTKIGGKKVGFELLSANVKREVFRLSYDHDILPLKYKMMVACVSANGKATLNAQFSDDDTESPPDASLVPQGESINNASRSHLFHYPANFFTGTSGYHYYGASSSAQAGNVSVEQVWAGKMVFKNGGREFNIGADGTNLKLHAQPGGDLTILASTVGVGSCYGFGVYDFTGVPTTLSSAQLQAIPEETVAFKRILLSFVRKDQPLLGDKAKGYLDGIINDIKVLHNTFKRGGTITLHPVASGYWNTSGDPVNYNGNRNQLNGNNAVTYQNILAVKHVFPQVKSYLETGLANAGVPINNFTIVVKPTRYFKPKDFDDHVDGIMKHNYSLEHEPKSWRLVLVTLGAKL